MTPSNPLADTIIGLYERHADTWLGRRNPAPTLEAAWLQRFVAGLPADATRADAGAEVLDIGCGTGQPIARWLVQQGLRVTGVDSSAAMLAHARRLQPDQLWVQADMRQLQLGRRFAGLLAWDSFFHLSPEAQRGMFAVFAAHAQPGAMLMFTSGPSESEAIGDFEGEPLFHASLSPDEYRALLAAHGFEVVAFVPEDPQCGRHTVWLCRIAPPSD
jgi:cyclopropane fatty-acyl-phospholipid synthase-like methyltransferase